MVQEINKDTVLNAEGLTFSYLDYEEGIKNINYEFKKGEVVLFTKKQRKINSVQMFKRIDSSCC